MLKFAGDFHVKMNTSYFQVYNKYLKSNNAWQNPHHTTYQRELSAQGADIYIEVSLNTDFANHYGLYFYQPFKELFYYMVSPPYFNCLPF